MPGSSSHVTAAVVVIGNEILSGRTRDSNLAYLARGLNEVGIRVREARVIPDVEGVIVETVNTLRARHAYVFTTGGIGPTHDDITAASVAKAFGVPLERNADAVRRLQAYYARPEVSAGLTEARLRMANVPCGAELLDNPVSGAPGFRMENVYVLAGVPSIMEAMFGAIKPHLRGGAVVRTREIVVYLPESEVARTLSRLQERYPDVEMGSYPFVRGGRFGTSLVLRSSETTRLAEAATALEQGIRELGVEPERSR
ncbi:MAG: competence/damage-inducible protein A [Gammaproteobacteria bacterium]|nr:competence/damage-inducible protein A [Gammaproteobacteria bacterium]NIR84063.1 competence/damage-inducible protein A [Gammaproteobacteria bacterium]NIR89207.1 competence/damage-inducible protein A [Gammaproteobacteria bacterium]NIU05009.1 competence/damage-inducible protein A [Gammaproteobacteria bacterium]NIV52175.1 competence/damage-inducible protein A [Gammaproteobacteria bacterium]